LIIKHPGPSLRAHRFGDLGEIGHPAAMWLVQFGIEHPQHDDVDAMNIACRPDNRFNVLPPGRGNGHGWQAADRATV
jgi:hypothetical protein